MSFVYVIDEEYFFAKNVASICRIDGFETKMFPDATTALDYFLTMDTIPADARLLVDCALAPGGNRSWFSPDQTDDNMTTGICLLNILLEKRPELRRSGRRVVLYTAHFTTPLWDKIKQFCDQNGFANWQKRPDAEPQDILTLVH